MRLRMGRGAVFWEGAQSEEAPVGVFNPATSETSAGGSHALNSSGSTKESLKGRAEVSLRAGKKYKKRSRPFSGTGNSFVGQLGRRPASAMANLPTWGWIFPGLPAPLRARGRIPLKGVEAGGPGSFECCGGQHDRRSSFS